TKLASRESSFLCVSPAINHHHCCVQMCPPFFGIKPVGHFARLGCQSAALSFFRVVQLFSFRSSAGLSHIWNLQLLWKIVNQVQAIEAKMLSAAARGFSAAQMGRPITSQLAPSEIASRGESVRF